jgi:hypothetical protein
VPLTLLSFTAEKSGLLKMGANHKMKLNFFAIAMPDYGYITNFGKSTWKDLVALQV